MAIVIPILKPGKASTDPSSYRPIALTSCLCKILEKMVNTRLMYYLEKNRCLSQHQSGFRRGRNTIDNVMDLESRIRNAFVRRKHLVAIFFDMEKAYDRTWRYGILRQLFNHDLRGNLAIFIQNFLTLRYFKVRVGNTLSDVFTQEEGVPQGSVLSVTLFILAVDNILKAIPTSVNSNLYVDDLHISCEGNDMRFINRQLQTAVNKISKWSDVNGISFSLSKTCCVHFCRKRGVHPHPEINFGGRNISVESEVKFLGIILDSKLSFIPHVSYLRRRCEKNLNILKVLSSTSWGADRTSLLKIYNSMIRSKLDYGCSVYGSARKSALQKLNTVQHTALRLCSGAFRTSPVLSLYADCCEAPLSIRRDLMSLQNYFRISSHANHPLHNHHFTTYLTRLYHNRPSCIPPFKERMKRILSDLNIDNINILVANSYFTPWKTSKFTFLNPFHDFDKSSTAPTIYQQLFYNHRQNFSSYIPVFTDGSKFGNFVGFCYIIADKVYSYKLHPAFSIFSAEIMAIYKAVEELKQYQRNKFIIYVDSMSVLESLSSPNHRGHPIIPKILNSLDILFKLGYHILFCWVPSHVGIIGNELADKNAKSAKNILCHDLPYCDAKIHIKALLNNKWQQQWDQQNLNKLHAIKPVIKTWPMQKSRKYDVTLTRLRIGHTRYTHSHLLTGDPAPTCQTCNVTMTVKHIFIECPDFSFYRNFHFHSHSPDMIEILGPSLHQNLLKFLKNIAFYPHI
jgi:ribonuclease HI